MFLFYIKNMKIPFKIMTFLFIPGKITFDKGIFVWCFMQTVFWSYLVISSVHRLSLIKTRAVTRQWLMPLNAFFIKIPTCLLLIFFRTGGCMYINTETASVTLTFEIGALFYIASVTLTFKIGAWFFSRDTSSWYAKHLCAKLF